MSWIRLHFDEDATQHALSASLRARRLDVLTALECGMVGKSDEEHLRHASSGAGNILGCSHPPLPDHTHTLLRCAGIG
jgi:hypothetical protein